MKRLVTILFLFLPLLVYSQFFLRDANNKIIGDESGVAISIVQIEDTTSASLPQAPDTAQVFNITMVNPGDESTPGLGNGVEAYYSLEETAGAVAFDSSASYDGDLINTPTQNETGISGLCYDFDYASSEYIDFGAAFWDVGTDDLSVSCWIQVSSGGNNGGIMGKGAGGSRWYIRASVGEVLKGVVDFGGGNIEVQTNGVLVADTWYHVVYRLDRDGNATLHIDNVLQTYQPDISGSVAVNLSNGDKFSIGNIGDAIATYYHNGLIDEVAIYNRLISSTEISQLYNVGASRAWPLSTAGGDTLNMTISGEDTRSDTIKVIWKYESWSTDTTDGTIQFRFPIDDMEDYRDTTFLYTGLGDTIVYYSAFTTRDNDITAVANRDTVFIDSSDITPPPQDPGGLWDTIFYVDFENNSAPSNYELADKVADWNGYTWFDSENRWPNPPWDALNEDSIKIDPLTGSKVVQYYWVDDIIGDYHSSTGPARGGESIYMPLGGNYHEVYVSFNVQFMSNGIGGNDFDFGPSGKLGGGVRSSSYNHGDGCPPPYGAGWTSEVMFDWEHLGSPFSYTYYPGMNCPYGDWVPEWNDFQPTGDGMQYYEDGWYYFDVSTPKWYNVTVRYVMNTFTGVASDNNAIIEGYINGRLVGRIGGLHLLDYPLRDTKIDGLFHRTFCGGGRPPLYDMWLYMDDVYVFTYDVSVDVPRGNELSPPGRVLNLPGDKKYE